MYFSADQAQVEPQTKKISLEGNVQIRQQTPQGNTRTVTGEKITFDQLNTQITAQGPVQIEDGKGGIISGQDISVNYTT
ncbi:MAG: LPS export ABC transporter periplasmic protein LptC, partial [Elusimicrobiaceae bacterium]|nr:LPS export ABC transporter periplasmic protein LptC [Elusimicrobiaceae bacterium]